MADTGDLRRGAVRRPRENNTGPVPSRVNRSASGARERPRLVQDRPGTAVPHGRDVLLVLQQDTQRLFHPRGLQVFRPEREEGGGPVQRLRHARALGEIGLPEPLHETDDLPGQRLRNPRHPCVKDGELALGAGVVDPMVEAAPLERVVDFAGPVAGQDYHRRPLGADGADLRDAHREIAQELEEEGLELLVGPIDLVDQQHGGRAAPAVQGAQQRSPDQELLTEDVPGGRGPRLSPRLQEPDLEHLAGIVPLVHRGVHVETFVALEPDQLGAEDLGQRSRYRRLADPRLPLQQQRPAEGERKEHGSGQVAVGHVAPGGEGGLEGGNVRGRRHGRKLTGREG